MPQDRRRDVVVRRSGNQSALKRGVTGTTPLILQALGGGEEGERSCMGLLGGNCVRGSPCPHAQPQQKKKRKKSCALRGASPPRALEENESRYTRKEK